MLKGYWDLLTIVGVFEFLFYPTDYYCFVYLALLGLSCNMWDLILSLGIKLRSPALGALSSSRWNIREVLSGIFSCNV